MGRTVFPLGPKAVTDPQVLRSTSRSDGHVRIGPKQPMHLHYMSSSDHAVVGFLVPTGLLAKTVLGSSQWVVASCTASRARQAIPVVV